MDRLDLTGQFISLGFESKYPIHYKEGTWIKKINDKSKIICYFSNKNWEPSNYLIIESVQTYMRKDDPNKFIKFSGTINKPEDLSYLLSMIL